MCRIPTVEQMRSARQLCLDTAAAVDLTVRAVREPASQIKRATADLYTSEPVGYFWHPSAKTIGWTGIGKLPAHEQAYCLTALAKIASVDSKELDGEDPTWVKVAYSPVIRRAGELLNFFPGNYTKGLPNSPGPIQSMLTSGLVGAGLGYGVGWLGEKLLPKRWKKNRLRKTLALLGGTAGVLPGAIWGATNVSIGKPFGSPDLLNHPKPFDYGAQYRDAAEKTARWWTDDQVELIKAAFGAGGGVVEFADPSPRTPVDVNINTLGQTLWEVGASPQTAAMTMGAMHAANQMPGGKGPGIVTPQQMARLAANMGAGYLSGGIVGAVLGRLTGLPPEAQSTLKRTGAYLGIVNAVVPSLFGVD